MNLNYNPWKIRFSSSSSSSLSLSLSLSLYTHNFSTQAVAEQGRLLGYWSGPGEARVDVVGFVTRGSHHGVGVV